MRKLLSAVLGIVLAFASFCTLAGCGGGNSSGDVVISFLHVGTRPEAFGEVEKELSKIAKEKLGFGIKFKEAVVGADLNGTYTNWIAANEDVDLLNVFGFDPMSLVNDKRAREISSLLTEENAPYLKKVQEEKSASYAYGPDGKLYGIAVFADLGDQYTQYCYTIRKDALVKIGLAEKYTNGQQIGYAELNEIFAAIADKIKTVKDLAGGTSNAAVYPCPAIGGGDAFDIFFNGVDPMGATQFPMGVLTMNPQTGEWNDEIVNYFETDGYKQYIEWVGSCKEKGWTHPDAETTSDGALDLFKRGQLVGCFIQNSAGIKNQWEDDYNCGELVQLPLTKAYTYLTTPGQALMISSKSKRPDRAMKIMNLLFEDVYFNNVFYYGVEGKNWKFVDGGKEDGYITEVEPGSRKSYMVGGFWGDYSHIYTYLKDASNLETAIQRANAAKEYGLKFAKEAENRKSPAWGFNYNSTKQNSRIRTLNTRIAEYATTLRVGNGTKGTDGTYTGPGSTYAELIQAMNSSNIAMVINDKKTQYAAWKASNN